MPPKGRVVSWTDEEKIAFLTRFLYHNNSKPNWNGFTYPDGRTYSACEHLMRGLKAKYVTGNSQANENGDVQVGTGKAKSNAKKRGSTAVSNKPSKKVKSEEAEDTDDDVQEEQPDEDNKGSQPSIFG